MFIPAMAESAGWERGMGSYKRWPVLVREVPKIEIVDGFVSSRSQDAEVLCAIETFRAFIVDGIGLLEEHDAAANGRVVPIGGKKRKRRHAAIRPGA